MGMFRYLKAGVSFILFFIGAKMLLGAIPALGEFFSAHSWVSLAVIVGTLTLSVLLSIVISEDKEIKNLKEENEQLKSKKILRRKNKEQ
jgi:tellurite resistance protein TerC